MSAHPLAHVTIKLTPISRYVTCHLCGLRLSEMRQGQNALAGTAKLRRRLREHLDGHKETTGKQNGGYPPKDHTAA